MKPDISLQVAWLIRYQGKQLLSLQESKACIGFLGAVLLALRDAGVIRIEPAENPQRAALLLRDIPCPEHLLPFYQSLHDSTVLGFMETWTAVDFPERTKTAEDLETRLALLDEEMKELLVFIEEGKTDEPRLIFLMQHTDLIGALFSPPILWRQEDAVIQWIEENREESELIETLPLLWMLRFVQ